jgi:cyclophilin family peptidyl-prolyl cis-trans isomerase
MSFFYRKFFFLFFSCFILFSCTKNSPESAEKILEQQGPFESSKMKTDVHGLSYLKGILKTEKGDIIIQFYPKEAPHSLARILTLISSGFYNGMSFHRVIPHFIIQTGSPQGTDSGGSGQTMPPEFNKIPHIKGTVALAHGGNVASADSQFYISLTTLPHLDGKFTVIGQVTGGLDVLDKIMLGDKIVSFGLKEK